MTGIKKPILAVVTGATASGKTAFSISLAQALATEIICADSRQIYKDMPVITAAPTEEEKRSAVHHLCGFLDFKRDCSAGAYGRLAVETLGDVFHRKNDVAVMCGGSQLYVDAVAGSLHSVKEISPITRQRILTILESSGPDGLLAYLRILDEDAENLIDIKNPRRVAHAAELIVDSGMPLRKIYRQSQSKVDDLPFRMVKFAICRSREELFERINRRVDEMISNGAMEEARRFFKYRKEGYNSLNSIGFNELFAVIGGDMELSDAVARIKKLTRVYAKKQLTWLKGSTDVVLLPADSEEALVKAMEIINLMKNGEA